MQKAFHKIDTFNRAKSALENYLKNSNKYWIKNFLSRKEIKPAVNSLENNSWENYRGPLFEVFLLVFWRSLVWMMLNMNIRQV